MQNIKERQEFENYNKLKLLGEGSFGKAFLVERVSDKLKCVMKQIDIHKMSESEKKETVQEAKILEALQHPNIVKFIEVYKTKKGRLCIVMDFADGGDMQNRMKEQRGKNFSEAQVLEWFTQICLGMKHVHDRKILHRDLKGQNIFLTKQGIVKIGDFGIAKVLASTMQNARTVVGTPYYLSPEIVQSKPYNFKSDIWSLGVVLYEMCALKPPFDAPSLHFLAMKIVRGAFNPMPSCYSRELQQLTASLLNTNEKLRPDVNKILSMPIMQNRIKAFLTETIYQKEFSHTILHKQNVFDPKQMQLKQLQNLQQQIQQNKVVTPAPQQARPTPQQQIAPRYNPSSVGAAAYLARPVTGNAAPSQIQQQPPPSSRLQQNRNGVSPGMQAAFGAAANKQPSEVKKPVQYGAGALGYQPPAEAKPNYHYQQQQQKPVAQAPQAKPQAPVQGSSVEEAKRQKERKDYEERMKAIDAKLKERENELKKIDDDKKERERKRQQYEKDLIDKALRNKESEKRSKEQDEQMAMRRLQDDQARKIQEAQQKRKEELDKVRREAIQRQQQEDKKKKDEQRKAEERAMKDRIEKQSQKQQESKNNDLDWIKKMTEDAQNKILDIEKKIIAKDQYNAPLPTNYDPPKARAQPAPQKLAPQRAVSAREQPSQQVQKEIKKAVPTQRQESEVKTSVNMIDKAQREKDRKMALQNAKDKWKFKPAQHKQDFVVEIVGMPDSMDQDDSSIEVRKEPLLEVKPPAKAMAQSNQNWNKPQSAPRQELKHEKSPQRLEVHKQPIIEAKPKKLSPVQLKYQEVEEEKQYNVFQIQPEETEYENNYQSLLPPDEDREIYQMYEEMLQLVKNDFYAEGQEEEKKDDDDDSEDSDDGGFNDDRDQEWDRSKLDKSPKASAQKGSNEKVTDLKKKIFDHSLQTINEESEPEGTFANTKQQKSSQLNSNIKDIDPDQDDRDDLDDGEYNDSTELSSDATGVGQQNNRLQDFTFANGDGIKEFNEISKFTSVEHLRDFLERELGDEKIMQAYPILKEFGDNIFFSEKTDELISLLKGCLSIQEINKYQAHFASLIFMELQAEKEGGGEIGIMSAMKTLKNINTTANFGKFF